MIYLFFSKGKTNLFSGQRVASDILSSGLSERNWKVIEISTPVLDRLSERTNNFNFVWLKFVIKFFLSLVKGCLISLTSSLIYVNPGQSTYALIRDGLPLLIRGKLGFESKGIISLHGNVFLNWRPDSREANLLKLMIQGSKYVTVLGSLQIAKLQSLGIDSEKIVQIDNTCITELICENDVRQKYLELNDSTSHNKKPLRILYLSYLLEAKGYIQFLEAIEILSKSSSREIYVTLCGQLRTDSDQTPRFNNDLLSSRKWIEELVLRVNKSEYVNIRWIEGATGKQKSELFKESHIFILPTLFRVEAQPISILEAIAYGCVVITSKVGEIPNTLSEDCAILLNDCSPSGIVDSIQKISQCSSKLSQIAINGFNLFKNRYSPDSHMERWVKLLETFFID